MTKRLLTFSPIRRTPKKFFLIACLLWCFGQSVASAAATTAANQADDVRELLPNTPIERALQGGETHIYKITLAAGSYLRLVITPRNLDLEVQLFAPDSSNDVGVYNDPTEQGIRFVSLVAETSGNYRLEIRPTDKDAQTDHYEVKIEESRPATEQDKIRVLAEKVEVEGALLVDYVNTAEQKRRGMVKYQEALRLWRQLGDRKSELRVLSNIATKERENGEPQTALEYAKQAIQIARDLGDRYQEANLIITFGILYRSFGENQKALDSFNQARQLFKSLSAKFGEAITFAHIGATLAILGELQEGLRYMNDALLIFSSLGDRNGECSLLNNMGKIYRLLGDTQKGIEFHNRALVIARQNQATAVENYALVHLGGAYFELGDKQKALDFAEQAVKLSRTLGDPLGEGDGLKTIGHIAYLSGDHQKALDYLNQSLQLFQSLWEREREAKTLHSLALVNHTLGNFDDAKKQIEKAIEIQESLRANVISQQLRETIFISAQTSFALYIDVLQQLHKKNPAAGFDAAALQASERARARSLLDLLAQSQADIRQGVPQHLLEIERGLQQQINAKATARTRLLSDKRGEGQAVAFDKEIATLTARYQEVEVQIRQSSPHYAALTQPQPLAAKEIQQLLDDNTVLLEFALGEKQSWLWAVTRSSLMSYQLPSHKEIEPAARKVYELLTARQPRKDETEPQYHSRIAKADLEFQTESARLSQMLFGQLATKLQQEWKGKRLAIIAPEVLEYVPFAALPVPVVRGQGSGVSESVAGGQGSGVSNKEVGVNQATHKVIDKGRPSTTDHRLLIAEYEIVNLPSASVLAALRKETAGRKAAEKTIAVIADPVFEVNDPRVLNALKKPSDKTLIASLRSGPQSPTPAVENQPQPPPTPNAELITSLNSFQAINQRSGFSRLPFSREEADAIAALTSRTLALKATDFQATRATALSGELARYRILHFATHGLLNSQHPELSGLVLSLVDEQGKPQDGFLRMHEIYNLHLPADLIVLSACQTALGKQIKGEGLVGLTRGFMYAGAERVVASLWQVDDLATAELMKRFYRGMLKEGLRPAAALRAAQLEMFKQKRWSSPYFWAAFTIQGEWQ